MANLMEALPSASKTGVGGMTSNSDLQLVALARTHLARSPGCTLTPSKVRVVIVSA